MILDAVAAILKVLLYASALASAGLAIAMASLGSGSVRVRRASARLLMIGAVVLIAAAASSFLAFLLRLGGIDREILAVAMETGPGRAVVLQLVGALGLIAGAALSRPIVATIAAIPVIFAFAVSGHGAAAAPWAGVAAGLHVAAAAWWTGALMLLRISRAHLGEAAFTDFVGAFGRQALAIVGGLVLLGLILGLRLLDGNVTLTAPYPRFLLVKVGFASGALLLALHNRLVLTPRLMREGTAAGRLTRAAGLELGFIGAVLATTALMTTFSAPN